MADKKKMGGMKLGNFSGIKSDSQPEELEVENKPPQKITPAKKVKTTELEKKLVPVNIKLEERQRVLLDEKARIIRSNNTEAVPAKDRVYPQHLIALAVDLLLDSDIDWSQIKNIDDLRKELDLGDQ
jgi:hypothetical protein